MQIFYCNSLKEDKLVYLNELPCVKRNALPQKAVIVGVTYLIPAEEGEHCLITSKGTFRVDKQAKKTTWYIPVGNHKYIGVAGKLPKVLKEEKKKTDDSVQKSKRREKVKKPKKENKIREKKGVKAVLISCFVLFLLFGGLILTLFILESRNKGLSDNSIPVIEESEEMEMLIEQSSENVEDISLKEIGIVLPSSVSKSDGELLVFNEKEGKYLSYSFYQDDVLLATSDMLPCGSSYTFSLSDISEGKLLIIIDVYDEASFNLLGSSKKVIKIKK